MCPSTSESVCLKARYTHSLSQTHNHTTPTHPTPHTGGGGKRGRGESALSPDRQMPSQLELVTMNSLRQAAALASAQVTAVCCARARVYVCLCRTGLGPSHRGMLCARARARVCVCLSVGGGVWGYGGIEV